MTRSALFAAVAAVCVSTTTVAQVEFIDRVQEQRAATQAFRDAIEPLVGTWKSTSGPDDGEQLAAVRTYTWDTSADVVIVRNRSKFGDEPWTDDSLTVLTPGNTADSFHEHWFYDGHSRVDVTVVSRNNAGNHVLTSEFQIGETRFRIQNELLDDSTMIEHSWMRSRGEENWRQTIENRWERETGIANIESEALPGLESQQAFRDTLSPFIGTWEIDATWAWGEALEARNVYAWDLSEGLVLAHTQAKDGDGPWYNRYLTVFAPGDAPDEFAIHTFTYDGTTRVGTMTVGESDDGNLLLSTSWTMGGSEIRQENELVDDNTMAWRVWMRQNDETPWAQVMDDEWERVMEVETKMAAPDAASESDKTIVRTATVDATPAEVWRAWTTSEGMTEWWVEEADIELKIGGKFELYMLPDNAQFAGNRGSEHCTVLAYAPERMLSATWNAPPTFPEQRFEHTRITLLLDPVDDDTTKVTLIHSGWPADGMADQSSKWPQVFEYFERAWTFVFDRMTMHFEG